jgi:hypothetical protein
MAETGEVTLQQTDAKRCERRAELWTLSLRARMVLQEEACKNHITSQDRARLAGRASRPRLDLQAATAVGCQSQGLLAAATGGCAHPLRFVVVPSPAEERVGGLVALLVEHARAGEQEASRTQPARVNACSRSVTRLWAYAIHSCGRDREPRTVFAAIKHAACQRAVSVPAGRVQGRIPRFNSPLPKGRVDGMQCPPAVDANQNARALLP